MIYCEVDGCEYGSVNSCASCEKALCFLHSLEYVDDEGHDVFYCPACYADVFEESYQMLEAGPAGEE